MSELVLLTPAEAETLPGEKALGADAGVTRFHFATLLAQEYRRCERCWNYRPSVGPGEPADLCDRCRQVLAAMEKPDEPRP